MRSHPPPSSPSRLLFPRPMSGLVSLLNARSPRSSLCAVPQHTQSLSVFFSGGGLPRPFVSTKVCSARDAGSAAAHTAAPSVCARVCGSSGKAWARPCCCACCLLHLLQRLVQLLTLIPQISQLRDETFWLHCSCWSSHRHLRTPYTGSSLERGCVLALHAITAPLP